MPRRRHHKAEKLSLEATRIVEDGLGRNVPYDEIAENVAAKTKETISAAALARYYSAKFLPRQQGGEIGDRAEELGLAAGSASPRRRHHKAEQLSDDARRIIEEGLTRNVSYDEIVARVAAETDDSISKAALGRYSRTKFEPRRQAQRATAVWANEIFDRAGDVSLSHTRDALEAMAAQQLFPIMEMLAQDKPEQVAHFYQALAGRRVEEQKVGQRMAALELANKRFELEKKALEAKLGEIARRLEAAAAPGKEAKPRTKAELEQTIRDLYGLARAPAQEAAK